MAEATAVDYERQGVKVPPSTGRFEGIRTQDTTADTTQPLDDLQETTNEELLQSHSELRAEWKKRKDASKRSTGHRNLPLPISLYKSTT